jgi:ubiquinone/menaquinone biosynthesis C-methylase UbiE
MREAMTVGQYLIGIVGVGLLRQRDTDPAHTEQMVRELQELLATYHESPLDQRLRTPVEDVSSGYGRWSETYDRPGNPLIAHEEPAVRELLGDLAGDPAGGPLLDAACGTGRHLAYLGAQGRRVIGVDASPEMLDGARRKVPDADLRVGDLTALPLDDEAVAGLVCALALCHVEDLEPVFAEFARVLRTGGVAVVSTLHPVMMDVYGWSAWFVDDDGRRHDIRTYQHSVSDYLNAATRHGFVVEACREPGISPAEARRMAASQVASAAVAAMVDVPIALVWRLRRV